MRFVIVERRVDVPMTKQGQKVLLGYSYVEVVAIYAVRDGFSVDVLNREIHKDSTHKNVLASEIDVEAVGFEETLLDDLSKRLRALKKKR